ncbi:(3S,6E)-nerolidol synthase [Trifolium repens]|nr:(3S,6E)-nerolidol synthase [Trifolium repens]
MLHGLVEMFLTIHKNALLILIQHGLNDIGHLSSELLRAWLSRHQNHSEAIYVANILQFPLHHGFSRNFNYGKQKATWRMKKWLRYEHMDLSTP